MDGARTSRFLLLLILSLLLCLLLPARGGDGGGSGRCGQVPSMTAERACGTVCGTPHMRELCLGTLAAPGQGAGSTAAVPVIRLAMAAVRGVLDSYTATAAAARSLTYGAAVQQSEKSAYSYCMVGYYRARLAMARVADDLAGGCDKFPDLNADYMAGLRGMDMCSRGMLNYQASPLYAMNIADRNKTLLAALLCSLVTPPPGDAP